MTCNICQAQTTRFGTQTVLRKFPAIYDRCVECGFLQVVNVSWLHEAYTSAIADVDLGTINRMVMQSQKTKIILHAFLDPSGKYMDYGGGYGAFVRRMRDLGYDFRWYDKHCENLFSKQFAADLSQHFALVTCFEVLEHLVDPMQEILKIAELGDNLLATTELIGMQPPALEQWSYYAPETGQHIAFYTQASMKRIAERIGRFYATDGFDTHLFSKSRISPFAFRLATRRKAGVVLERVFRRASLLDSDFQAVRRLALNGQDDREH